MCQRDASGHGSGNESELIIGQVEHLQVAAREHTAAGSATSAPATTHACFSFQQRQRLHLGEMPRRPRARTEEVKHAAVVDASI